MIIRDGEKIVSKNKLDNDPIMSTKVIRQSIYELIDNKSINHRRRKAIIEFGKERCFVKGNQKIVMSQDGKILWRTIIENEINERFVSEKEADEGEWREVTNWANKMNKRYNDKRGKISKYINK